MALLSQSDCRSQYGAVDDVQCGGIGCQNSQGPLIGSVGHMVGSGGVPKQDGPGACVASHDYWCSPFAYPTLKAGTSQLEMSNMLRSTITDKTEYHSEQISKV